MQRVGIIGAGLMGRTHARTIMSEVSDAKVTCVADAFGDAAERLADEYGLASTTDPQELMSRDDVDAVIIATPGFTHPELTLTAIGLGKPVLCEKPFAVDVVSAEEVLNAERALPEPLITVGFMRRFDEGYRRIRDALASGEYGAPYLAYQAHRSPASSPSPGKADPVGWILDGGVHEVDVTRWLLGREIVEVEVVTPLEEGATDRPVLALLHCEDGVVSTLELNGRSYGYDIRCEVLADRASFSLDDRRTSVRRDATDGTPVPLMFQERFGDAYRRELQAWLSRTPAFSDAATSWDGYVATVVCDALVTALREGKRQPVQLLAPPAPAL
jgi:myo-inositol 2-dehydrogenase/D-chiro-inositol 1-dehydrogenase